MLSLSSRPLRSDPSLSIEVTKGKDLKVPRSGDGSLEKVPLLAEGSILGGLVVEGKKRANVQN